MFVTLEVMYLACTPLICQYEGDDRTKDYLKTVKQEVKQGILTWSPSWRHIGEHRTGNLREQNLPYYSILQNHNKTFYHEFHSKKRKEVCVYTSRDLGMPPEEITAGKYTDIGHQ